MRYETIKVSEAGRVATVTLARPDVRNAFNETTIAELTTAFEWLDAHEGVRAIVLAAEGAAFCAGADLNWMKKMAGYSDDENRADARKLARMLEAIHRCGKPVIARVHGDAYAGGVGGGGRHRDRRRRREVLPVGSAARVDPATIAPYVVRAMGERAARRYFTTAEVFDSTRAASLGFIHDAVPADALDETVAKLAATLVANGPDAVKACKRLVADVAGRPLDATLIEQTADWIARTRAGAEAREGIASFLESARRRGVNDRAARVPLFPDDTEAMFDKILIANRGEIACRVAATCKRLGIASVAVYSDADANAKHVAACDEAVHIGGSAAADSYLRIERIIEAARATGAQAIHPGYGFLSENEDFAHACEAAGIVFIGPPVDAIAAMGSKAAAKALMHAAAVPLVPGYHGDDQDASNLHREADAIGYPVLLKASAGGGGRGCAWSSAPTISGGARVVPA